MKDAVSIDDRPKHIELRQEVGQGALLKYNKTKKAPSIF